MVCRNSEARNPPGGRAHQRVEQAARPM